MFFILLIYWNFFKLLYELLNNISQLDPCKVNVFSSFIGCVGPEGKPGRQGTVYNIKLDVEKCRKVVFYIEIKNTANC